MCVNENCTFLEHAFVRVHHRALFVVVEHAFLRVSYEVHEVLHQYLFVVRVMRSSAKHLLAWCENTVCVHLSTFFGAMGNACLRPVYGATRTAWVHSRRGIRGTRSCVLVLTCRSLYGFMPPLRHVFVFSLRIAACRINIPMPVSLSAARCFFSNDGYSRQCP